MLTFMLLSLLAAAGARQDVIVIDSAPAVRMSLAGLDLTQAGDRRAADRQIRETVRLVCSERFNPGTDYREMVACVNSSLSDARQQLNAAVKRYAERRDPSLAAIDVSARH